MNTDSLYCEQILLEIGIKMLETTRYIYNINMLFSYHFYSILVKVNDKCLSSSGHYRSVTKILICYILNSFCSDNIN